MTPLDQLVRASRSCGQRCPRSNMCIDRRNFLRASVGLAGAAMMPSFAFADTNEIEAIQQRQDVPDLIRNLRPMTKDVVPITQEERLARIAKAQRLMGDQKIDAIYM